MRLSLMPLYSIIMVLCSISAAFYYAYNHQIIIVRLPKAKTENEPLQNARQEKNITLFYWQNNQWKSEDTKVIWPADIQNQLQSCIQAWLKTMHDEDLLITTKLEAALTNSSGKEGYISFDRSLFGKQQSIQQKLQIIQSLLKTIDHTLPTLNTIHILVHHQPMVDAHLDFSQPWPIKDFI